jgi:hypothetical protein
MTDKQIIMLFAFMGLIIFTIPYVLYKAITTQLTS